MSCFTPKQYRMVMEGLLAAFPNRVSLANMLIAVADTHKVKEFPHSPIIRRLQNINLITSEESNMEKVVFDVLQIIQASTLCRELVKTAHEWNPFNPQLESLSRQFMQIKAVEQNQEREIERLLSITREQFLNPLTFAQRFGPIRYRVCRIEISNITNNTKIPHATGFLVGPDVVMTNHHVVEPVLSGQLAANNFFFGFDRVELDDGTQTSGPTYGLKTPNKQQEWLVALDEELDYAVLRLDTRVGESKIISETIDQTAATRGWLLLSEQGSQNLTCEAPLLIFQHPDGLPLRLDIRAVGMIMPTRITYTTNTMPGSSGSPCFDRELRVSALHRGCSGALNEGVPVSAILADLKQNGLQECVDIAD